MYEQEAQSDCGKTDASLMKQIRTPDLVEKLTAQKEMLEQQLGKINEALDVLKSNPELERVFRLVSKVSFRL